MNCLGSSSIYFSINHAPGGLFARNRERIGKKGGSVGKRRKGQGFLAKPPFFFPLSIQNREGGGRGMAGRSGVPAGGSSRGGGQGQGEKEEGGEGVLFSCSPRAIVHGGGGSTGE
jgi:hypothetical protein